MHEAQSIHAGVYAHSTAASAHVHGMQGSVLDSSNWHGKHLICIHMSLTNCAIYVCSRASQVMHNNRATECMQALYRLIFPTQRSFKGTIPTELVLPNNGPGSGCTQTPQARVRCMRHPWYGRLPWQAQRTHATLPFRCVSGSATHQSCSTAYRSLTLHLGARFAHRECTAGNDTAVTKEDPNSGSNIAAIAGGVVGGLALLLLAGCAGALLLCKRRSKRKLAGSGATEAAARKDDAVGRSIGSSSNRLSNTAMLKPDTTAAQRSSSLGAQSFPAGSTTSSRAGRIAALPDMSPNLLVSERIAPPGEGTAVFKRKFTLNLPSTLAEPNLSERLITALLNMATPPAKEFAGEFVLSDDFVEGGQVCARLALHAALLEKQVISMHLCHATIVVLPSSESWHMLALLVTHFRTVPKKKPNCTDGRLQTVVGCCRHSILCRLWSSLRATNALASNNTPSSAQASFYSRS